MSELFPIITGEHWRRAIARGRAEGNAALAAIRAAVARSHLASGSPTVLPTTEHTTAPAAGKTFASAASAAAVPQAAAARAVQSPPLASPSPMQGSLVAKPQTHNLVTAGSIPAPAPTFTAAGSADRKGGGTPRAEAGGGEHLSPTLSANTIGAAPAAPRHTWTARTPQAEKRAFYSPLRP